MRYRSITMIDGDEPARAIELHADTRSHVVATNDSAPWHRLRSHACRASHRRTGIDRSHGATVRLRL